MGDYAENEIGMSNAQEAAGVLRADAVAFAKQAARADADQGLVDVEESVGVACGVDKGGDARSLIGPKLRVDDRQQQQANHRENGDVAQSETS